MAEPSAQLVRFSQRLFQQGEDQAAFMTALTQPQPDSPAILWTQSRSPASDLPWQPLAPVDWQPSFVDRLPVGTRPGQHPLHRAGAFYCLDLSSVFAASVVQAIAPVPQLVIDLCAAPGGKSLYTAVACQPHQLLCNEVVRKRVKILIANLKRCGLTQARVMNLEPGAIAARLPQAADLVLVDAPCSGQSLLAKGQSVPGCFHRVTLQRNAKRQRRIMAAAAALVRPGGHLAYMTCTYATEENEQVGRWFLKTFAEFQAVAIPHLAAYRSPFCDWPCYRLWPQMGLGAGAFTSLFQRRTVPENAPKPLDTAFIKASSFEIYGSEGNTNLEVRPQTASNAENHESNP